MKRVDLSRWSWLPAMALLSCGPIVDQSEPWWSQVVPGATRVLDAAFNDDASQLTVAFLSDEGTVHLGSVDVMASSRTIKDLGQATFVPEVPTGAATFSTETIDLSIRPGSSEAWLFVSGLVYRFPAGKTEGARMTDSAGTVTGVSAGSLGFLGKDTLIYGTSAGLFTYPIMGDTLGPQVTISKAAAGSGDVRQVAGVDGQIWTTTATSAGLAFTPTGTALPFSADQQFIGQPLIASAGGAAWYNTSSHIGFCIVPRHANGGATRPDSKTARLDAACDNLDLPFPSDKFPFRRAELATSGRRAALTTGSSLFLVSEDQPAAVSSDLEGTWCALSGASFTVEKGVVTTLGATSGIDSAFKRVVLTGGGSIRNIELQEPDEAIKKNVVRSNYDYFFKRTGNSLMVYGPVTQEQRERGRSYLNRSGFYVKGTDATCQTLSP